jgi:hypothetical protein
MFLYFVRNFRTLELLRDTHEPGYAGETVPFKLVTKACAEYLENPIIMTIKRACILDKLILCTVYRYNVTVAVNAGMPKYLTGFELYLRFADILAEVSNKQRAMDLQGGVNAAKSKLKQITMQLPQWEVFEEAVIRLFSQGILRRGQNCAHFSIANHEDLFDQHLLQTAAIFLNVDPIDVKTAMVKSGDACAEIINPGGNL